MPRHDIPELLEAILDLPNRPYWKHPRYCPDDGYVVYDGERLDLDLLQVLNFKLFGFSLAMGKSRQCWESVAKEFPLWQNHADRTQWSSLSPWESKHLTVHEVVEHAAATMKRLKPLDDYRFHITH